MYYYLSTDFGKERERFGSAHTRIRGGGERETEREGRMRRGDEKEIKTEIKYIRSRKRRKKRKIKVDEE